MATPGVATRDLRYTSNLIEDVPTTEADDYTFKAAPLKTEVRSDEDDVKEEWMDLYHVDRTYASFVNDLFALSSDEDEERPPARSVIDKALELTPLAKKLLAQNWQTPVVNTDGGGGLRMSWRHHVREVRAVIPADERRERYLYWQDGARYDAIRNFGSATLYERLKWLDGQSR